MTSDHPGPRPPRPLLSRRSEERLGPRHREVLDQLEALFLEGGFAGVTVGELAAGVGCSRRTLYEIAPSKDDLVLVVLDRFLHRVGRSALGAIDPDAPIARQIGDYFRGGMELHRLSTVLADDLDDRPAARRLLDQHMRHVMAVVERLVEAGVERGELRPTPPALVAGVLTGSALYLTQPDVTADLDLPRDQLTDELIDLVLRSIVRRPDDREAH
ncbi:MAG: TetR/AcrR family transcriptional regulator [Acidimicrobiales bacterium]